MAFLFHATSPRLSRFSLTRQAFRGALGQSSLLCVRSEYAATADRLREEMKSILSKIQRNKVHKIFGISMEAMAEITESPVANQSCQHEK